MRPRLVPALGLAALLAAPGSTLACETVLLELILARDVKSEFEEKVKILSRLLLDIGERVRNRGGAGANFLRSRFQAGWAELYEKHYLAPPPGHRDNPVWRNLCDNLTARSGELRALTRGKRWDEIHDALRAAQDALTAFYLPAPRPGEPKAEFDVVRTLLAGLARAAGGEDAAPADLASNLEHIETRLGVLRDAGVFAQAAAEDAAAQAALQRFRTTMSAAASARTSAAAALSAPVEALRTRVLAAAWFAPKGPPRAGAPSSPGAAGEAAP